MWGGVVRRSVCPANKEPTCLITSGWDEDLIKSDADDCKRVCVRAGSCMHVPPSQLERDLPINLLLSQCTRFARVCHTRRSLLGEFSTRSVR